MVLLILTCKPLEQIGAGRGDQNIIADLDQIVNLLTLAADDIIFFRIK